MAAEKLASGGTNLRYQPMASSESGNYGLFETSWSSPFIVQRKSWVGEVAGIVPWVVLGALAWKFAKR